jgi:hypothetical protein
MDTSSIAEISIDPQGRLRVTPESAKFPFVYRAAMEVNWDEAANCLYSPPPREWTYEQWFKQILAAVRDEYGCSLLVTSDTRWSNVNLDIQQAIIAGKADEA